jgi:hypothetical protein
VNNTLTRQPQKKRAAPLVFHPNADELIRALSIALGITPAPTQPPAPTPARLPRLPRPSSREAA